MHDWIDFKALRAELRFADVLAFYRVQLNAKGNDQHGGFCPLPTHEGTGKRSPSFSANLARGIWRCFGCGASGNVLDFAVRMQGLDPERPADVRQAALALVKQFGLTQERGDRPAPKTRPIHRRPGPTPHREEPRPSEPVTTGRVLVNEPLDFALKHLDPGHPYLTGRGLTRRTIERFGLGYCDRGLLAGRVAIPLHDIAGRLLGYAGRLASDEKIDADRPKYLFPPQRTRDGVTFRLGKSLFVYNAHRVDGPVGDLVIVEGFPSVWWLWQHGLAHAVALMGACCSEAQTEAIVALTTPDARVRILTDGDAVGGRCAAETLGRVAVHRFCRWVQLPEGRQPTDCTGDALHDLLGR